MRCHACNAEEANLDSKSGNYYCSDCRKSSSRNLHSLANGNFTLQDLFELFGETDEGVIEEFRK